MKSIILSLVGALVLAACGNSNPKAPDSSTAADTGTHNTHNVNPPVTSEAGSGNHMKAMHDAMNGMMQQMKAMEPIGDADHDFAMMMKHHHQSAIEMARSELAGGDDAQIKQMAEKIVNDQQREIASFDQFLQNHQPQAGNSDYGARLMGMMTDVANINMEGGSLDAMFASMMIPHHQDAVKMAQEYLKVAKNQELKEIANNIISSQPKEVNAFQNWLAARKSAQ